MLFLRHKGKNKKPREARGQFANGVSIAERPAEVSTREEFGHWELDSMVSSRDESKGCFSTFVERTSRLLVAYVGLDRTASTMENAIKQLFIALPQGAFKTATSDRGKEFACHQRIKEQLGLQVYFADAYAPWQRGSNENANGLLREFYPKRTDLATVTQAELAEKLYLINNRPRKVLGWKTPIEVFLQKVSHLV